MRTLPARAVSLQNLHTVLCQYVEDQGISGAAMIIGVSTDTMRRRTRGEQPWFLAEVLDLARAEAKQQYPHICEALSTAVQGQVDHEFHPLRIPGDLRAILRLIGRITTDIADTLDDGRVDATESENLLGLLTSLDSMTTQVRQQLKQLIAAEKNR